MSAQSTPLDHSDSGRELLQSRVALAGKFGFGVGFGFVVYRVVTISITDYTHLTDIGLWFHFAASMFLFVMWMGCRTGSPSVRVIHTFEAIGMIGACAGYCAMGATMRPVDRPDFIVLCALSYGLMARAAYVPSTPKRTAVISCIVALPALAMTYYVMANVDIARWSVIMPDIRSRSSTSIAIAMTSFNLAWWICTVALCTLTTHVVYGLRKEMRNVRKLGQYTLHAKLGEGGMGAVYRASHAMLRRPTAVKLLPPEKAGERALARFEREVQLTASLTHPNTVTIHDYGRTPDGICYYAMELLDGATLAEVVELSGSQPIGRVVHVIGHVASALHEAHQVGLIHRDIKPANIMLVRAGGVLDVPKVLDFGLVKDLDDDNPSVSLTQTDHLTGTPQYICPEAIRSPEQVDARSDIYSLGAVAYFLLTGQHVFTGETVIQVCGEHLHATPISPSERLGAEIPETVETLVLECLAKDPKDRPQHARELDERLREIAKTYPWTEQDALEWWERYGTGVGNLANTSDSAAYEQTIAVDIASRQHNG